MLLDNPIAFIKQTISTFRTTGAVAPSSPFLARALAKSLPDKMPDSFRLLEIGPGTGSVTKAVARKMNGQGVMELWEINPAFCSVLRHKCDHDPHFLKMKGRIEVHEGDVRDMPKVPRFDVIISGLPFNCFTPDEVQTFLDHFKSILKPGGTLSWFEYVAIRTLQSPFVGKQRRIQLQGVGDVTGRFVRDHQFRQQIIPINIPPARVRHLRFG